MNISLEFLKSALTKEGKHLSTADVMNWINYQNRKVKVAVTETKFSELGEWHYSYNEGVLRHSSGKFFTIEGINVTTNWGPVHNWQQPIINQPEIGYLGFIIKYFDGILHFLLQAKIEPGNVNCVQLSPTLQATKSNYTRVHKGNAPSYLSYFTNALPHQIVVDQLQSEQGARFLKKRNRNIMILIDANIPIEDNFIWLTLGQIKDLMSIDNIVNMDTRTVLSGIHYGEYERDVANLFCAFYENDSKHDYYKLALKSALTVNNSLNSIDSIIAKLTQLKSQYELNIDKIPIKQIKNWDFTDSEIYHLERKYFRIIAVDVEIENREVVKWSQPMVQPMQEGLCAFVCKEIGGILHFAVQAKLECGNHDIIEFAPTVQCLTGNYRDISSESLPFLDVVLKAPKENIVYDTYQSEEGGRFYKEQNRNMIVMVDQKHPEELPNNYVWMTLNQMMLFLKFNNFFNIQARSLIAAVKFI